MCYEMMMVVRMIVMTGIKSPGGGDGGDDGGSDGDGKTDTETGVVVFLPGNNTGRT